MKTKNANENTKNSPKSKSVPSSAINKLTLSIYREQFVKENKLKSASF